MQLSIFNKNILFKKFSRINRLYLSNFLTGLVFWYGIEKLFMTSIGITAAGVGIATAIFLTFNLIFDIPAGIMADRWSRKGMLAISALGLALASFIMGSSHDLALYMFGEIFYGVYIVADSGTFQAIIYDILHEENRSDQYSKIIGRAQAIFLIGTAVANAVSGFIVHVFSFQTAYFVSIVSCILNILIILSIQEPTFHKNELKEKVIQQLADASNIIKQIKVLRVLGILAGSLAVMELFKSEFAQLYMLRYVSSPQLIGILWSIYALTWSIGSLLAYKFRSRIGVLIIFTTLPYVIMSFVDTWLSLILFMMQAIASAALVNQIETKVQENTPSKIRASMLSILSFLGRAVSIPSSFLIGWIIYQYNALWAVRFIAMVALLILIYWVMIARKLIDDKHENFKKITTSR